jgi:hypothetical protein
VNNTFNNRISSTRQTLPSSACSWIFVLILCCLPGLSLYDTIRTEAEAATSATPPRIGYTPNTQVAVNSHDSALTSSQRLLSQTKRLGTVNLNTHKDNADRSDLLAVAGAYPAACELRLLISGQGYDSGSVCLPTPFARAPYSPRSPPVRA